jgi:hypothetical protein
MESIVLEPDQQRTLDLLVEITRRVPRDQRQPIKLMGADGYNQLAVVHPGVSSANRPEVYPGDISVLAENGLLRFSPYQYHGGSAEVTPLGMRYYDWIKQRESEPTARIEEQIRQYMDAAGFARLFPVAYERWLRAERVLWSGDSEPQFTTIGHLCREALQEFADAAIKQTDVRGDVADPSKTIARLRAVLRALNIGTTRRAFLEALLAYWGTVSDLVQKQEHGGARESEPLVWEDARRVVFHTMMVMYEWNRTIAGSQQIDAPAT